MYPKEQVEQLLEFSKWTT